MKHQLTIIGLGCLLLACTAGQAAARTIHVALQPPYDYNTITAAMGAAQAGDTIWVSQGVYSNESGEIFPLRLKDGVVLKGVESIPKPEIRGNANVSLGTGNTVLEGFNLADSQTTIQGLKIADGFGNSRRIGGSVSEVKYIGGGIYLNNSNVTIRGCDFIDCRAEFGGAIALFRSDVTIQGSHFSRNNADWGGGVYTDNTTLICETSSFQGNKSVWGGGLFSVDSEVTIQRTAFYKNHVRGVYTGPGQLQPAGGSAISVSDTNLSIENSIYSGNTYGDIRGQGVGEGTIHFDGVVFLKMNNCTFSNDLKAGWDIFDEGFGNSIITNSLFNRGPYPSEKFSVQYSNVYRPGGPVFPGIGNINANPSFIPNGGLNVSSDSPSIDAGLTSVATDTDFRGLPRPNPNTNTADMGAYEFYSDGPLEFEPGFLLAGFWESSVTRGASSSVTMVVASAWLDSLFVTLPDYPGFRVDETIDTPFGVSMTALHWDNLIFPLDFLENQLLFELHTGTGSFGNPTWPYLVIER